MADTERAINLVFDKTSGKTITAKDVFKTQKDSFEIRRKYQVGEIDLYCLECDQKMGVSTSSLDRGYFRHIRRLEYCILGDDSLPDEIIEDYYHMLQSRESQRHKDLKNKIGNGLTSVSGVDPTEVIIDTRFIIRQGQRRRPDVYCRYYDQEIAFEIQLSPLSLRYITHRFEFYRKNNIYLVWIIDNKNPKILSKLQRDIKYLSQHQNLFALDEETSTLKFICAYKRSFIQNQQVLEKWYRKSVGIENFTFCNQTIECYYFDYLEDKKKQNKILELSIQKAEYEEARRIQEERRQLSERKINDIIEKIKDARKKDFNFYTFHKLFDNFYPNEISRLNEKLQLDKITQNGQPALNYYIKSYIKKRDGFKESFIEFLLTEEKIKLEVNGKSPNNRGCLQELYENPALQSLNYKLLPALFKRGYQLTEYDLKYFENTTFEFEDQETTIRKLKYLGALTDRELAPMVCKYFSYLLFIESALQKKIIGSRLKNWVQYIVGIQGGYKDFWLYTKLALKKNGTWDLILACDKKGTFFRKIEEFNLENIEVDDSISPLLYELYPEIFDYMTYRSTILKRNS